MALLLSEGIKPVELKVTDIMADGLDASDKIIRFITEVDRGIEALIASSVPIGGFNMIDPAEIFLRTKTPSVFILGEQPREGEVEGALRRHFPDWERRVAILKSAGAPRRFEIAGAGEVYLSCYGLTPDEGFRIALELTVFGKVPEPLRVCCMIAKAVS